MRWFQELKPEIDNYSLAENKMDFESCRKSFKKSPQQTEEWWRGVVVKHADSRHRGCQFDSSMCHL